MLSVTVVITALLLQVPLVVFIAALLIHFSSVVIIVALLIHFSSAFVVAELSIPEPSYLLKPMSSYSGRKSVLFYINPRSAVSSA